MSAISKYLRLTIGIMLTMACVLFMVEFIRGLDFEYLEDNLLNLPNLALCVVCGLAGIPLVLSELSKFDTRSKPDTFD